MRQPFDTSRAHESASSVSLIHPETHFTDEKAGQLRSATYRRLRRHWHFTNALFLFEVHDQVNFGVHIYGGSERDLQFLNATYLYHPDTLERSLKHDGSGTEPGLKDDDGHWDLRPHASRIQRVDLATLGTWHAVLESDEVPVGQSRMVYTVNRSTAAVLDKLSRAPRIGSLGLQFSRGWDESIDRKKGMFDSEWGVPESWDSVILQGPHLHVANPFFKQPNPTMLHNQDWTAVDLEALPPDAIPATSYKPRGDRAKYNAEYTHWQSEPEGSVASRARYRVVWRTMAATTGERTLIPTLLPRGAAHVDGCFSAGSPSSTTEEVALVAAFASSMLLDFSIRSVPKKHIRVPQFERLPFVSTPSLRGPLLLRILRLTCMTNALAALWEECFDPSFQSDTWATSIPALNRQVGAVEHAWSTEVPLRNAVGRRQALIEIDALVALALGVTADELATVYRTQFPVMAGYDRSTYLYDVNGRQVPNPVLALWRQRGVTLDDDDLVATHPGSGYRYRYVPPFAPRDREVDLRRAHEVFAGRLTNRSNST